ncbi:MAG: hypothetical protein CMJ83_11885 [Planctomycetes bacterium]|nr:hypothetical protein [Planctomycetota bacterium]
MRIHLVWLLPSLVLFGACSGGSGGGGVIAPVGGDSNVGGPIMGLPQATRDAFDRGKALMTHSFTPSEGLGPYYNATSCAACHEVPVTGGSSPPYRNFYLAARGFPGFQQKLAFPPDLPSLVIPSFTFRPAPGLTEGRVVIPVSVPGIPITSAQRNAPPMFGTGLFEFVTDVTIMGLADPDDGNGDGISGRFNTTDMNIGRFGYKAQSNNIEVFIRGAAENQMGMTSNPVGGASAVVSLSTSFLPQLPGSQTQPSTDADPVPDPEISVQDFGDIIAFSKFLAPPTRLADTPASMRGETMFGTLGCTDCHLPSIPSSIGPLAAFTDLLLHDMGPGLADGLSFGVPQVSTISPGTTESEFRTQPLWGVRLHAPFLHGGQADTLNDAILAHGGEAQVARDAYQALAQTDKDDIIAFLEIL